jgi:hypothetical protein
MERRRQFYALARQAQDRLAQAYPGPLSPCISDLSDVFDDVEEEVYEDGGHLFDNGNEIVAKRIVSELIRCGVIGPKPGVADGDLETGRAG